jgi:hypothetical protein
VGSDLNAEATTEFQAPSLESVGGNLNVQSTMIFNAPILEDVEQLLADSITSFNAPNFNASRTRNFL